jgi:iron complex transport system substrate-binding protein
MWFVVMFVVVTLAACRSVPPTSALVQVTAVPVTPTAVPSSNVIIVTDAMNRTVKFDKVPQRIVLAGKAFFMIVDAIYLFPEAKQRVVGMHDTSQSKLNFMPLIDPNMSTKTLFPGGDAGPEQILPAKPDVVITKSPNASKLGKSLEQVNIPVIYVDFELPEQYARDLAILGQLLGNPDRAQKIDAYYKMLIDRVTAKTKNLKDSDKPNVLLLQYAEKSGTVAFNIAPAEWMQTLIVEMAGGKAMWKSASDKGGWTVVNLEQIAAWNPEMVFIVNYSGNSKEAGAKLKADPKWQSLKAVRDNKIYGFPSDFYTWDQPDTRWGLGLLWLATKIQPTLFNDVNINQEINQFYALYGLDQATVQAKVTPLLQGDLP